MDLRQRLTNEEIKRRSGKDSFYLVNYAIGIGRDAILRGRDFHTETPIRNQAFQILLEIDEGADQLPPKEKEAVEE